MNCFKDTGRRPAAVIVGASGGIGAALTASLAVSGVFVSIAALSRSGGGPDAGPVRSGVIDVTDDASVSDAAARVAALCAEAAAELRLVIVASGLLHAADGYGPEKSWRQIEGPALARAFAVNTIGPAVVARHFLPLMPRQGRSILAALSARVGSISDNRAGGWYGYRASKTALNQILKCLAIEEARRRPGLVVAGLQPGTVRTALSEPFRGGVAEEDILEPETAARHLIGVLDGLTPDLSGRVWDWRGEEVPP